MAWIGDIIGILPFIPKLSSEFINTVVFFLTILFPLSVGVAISIIKLFNYIEEIADNEIKIPIILKLFSISLNFIIIFVFSKAYYSFLIGDLKPGIIVFILSLFIFTLYLFYLKYVPGYFRGLVAAVGFIFTIEILYLVSIPGLSDYINNLSCEILNISLEIC